jgi:hypothetical protein
MSARKKGTENMPMNNTRRRILQNAAIAGAGGLLLAATVIPAAASPSVPVDEAIPALASPPQTEADAAPSVVNLDALGVEASELRSLGSDEVADYWVARSGTEDVCLVAHIRGGNDVASSACVSIGDFYQSGIGLVTGESQDAPDRSTEAYLIPADVDATLDPHLDEALQAMTAEAQFVAVRPGSIDFTRAEIERADGSTFVFTPISLR